MTHRQLDASDPVLLSGHVLFDEPQAEPPHGLLISDDGFLVTWLRERTLVLFRLSTGKQTSGGFDHDGKYTRNTMIGMRANGIYQVGRVAPRSVRGVLLP